MNSNDLAQFNQATALSQAGQKAQAYKILSQLARTYPNDSNVLLWLAFSADDLRESRQLLDKVAQIDPQNATLPGAREWLAQEEQKQAVVAVPVMAAPALPAPEKKSWRDRGESTALPKPDPAAAATPDGVVPKPPEEPKEKASWLFSSAAILGGIVILAGILFFLFSTIFLGDKLVAKGLPVYANATRVEFDQRDKDVVDAYSKLMTASTGGLLKDVSLEIYKVKKTELSKFVQFYNTEMKKQGWEGSSVNTGTNSGVFYLKEKKMLIFTTSSSTGLVGNYNITPDDTLIVGIYGELDLGAIKK
jgi:tetratricopeptide (TPR) repeat protein